MSRRDLDVSRAETPPQQGPFNLLPGLLGDPRTTPRGFNFAPGAPYPYQGPHFHGIDPRVLPRGNVAGNLQQIPRQPPLTGIPFQLHHTPHSPLHSHPNIRPVPLTPPPGVNISPVGPPGSYFLPPIHNLPQTPPFSLALQGPNIPPPSDPTDVFLREWLSGVTASYKDRQKDVQEDRPMKASLAHLQIRNYTQVHTAVIKSLHCILCIIY